jgi:heptosyltransferase-2
VSAATPVASRPAAPGLQVPVVPPGQRRILIRLPNWLGDIVMAAPTVAAIAVARPEAELIAQVRTPFMPLAERLPGVARVVPAGRDRTVGDLLRSRRALRHLAPDAAVILPRSARATLAPWLARVPVRVGFSARGLGRLLTHGVRGWRPLRSEHRSAWFAALAGAFDAHPGAPWRMELDETARLAGVRLLAGLGHRAGRPLVVLEPGASYGPAKCWPPERFGDLAASLIAEGIDVVTVGTEATRRLEARVAARAGGGLLRAAGRTDDLSVLIGVLGAAGLVVSNDTGPMHLAAALATPTLALFGATDPVVSGPMGQGVRHLIFEPEPCSPCLLRDCPIPGHPCMRKIGVARVHRAAREVLEAGSGAPPFS